MISLFEVNIFSGESSFLEAVSTVSQIVIALGALIASSIAVWIAREGHNLALKESEEDRNNRRLSVRPHLVFHIDHSNHRILLQNKGVGPAVIEKVMVFLGGEQIEGDAETPWRSLLQFYDLPMETLIEVFGKDDAISPGEEYVLLHIRYPEEADSPDMQNRRYDKFKRFLKEVNIRVEYRSIQDEVFTRAIQKES